MARTAELRKRLADFFARDTRIRFPGEEGDDNNRLEGSPGAESVSVRSIRATPTLSVPEKAADAGDLRGAIAFYHSACARPGGERYWIRLGELHQRIGGVSEALAAFEMGFTKDPTAREAYRKYLFLQHTSGSIAAAIPAIAKVAEERRDIPEPWNYLGVAYFMAAQAGKAAEVWQRLIERFPRFSPARANYASYLIHVGRTTEAVLHLRLAADLEPEMRSLALNNIAEIHIQRGEYDQALRILREAASDERGQYSSAIYTSMGHCHQALGQTDDAIRAYRESLQKEIDLGADLDRLDALTQLAKLYLGQGHIAEAEKTCTRALHLGAKNSSLLATYGQVLIRRGRYEEAVNALREAAAAHPNNPKTVAIFKNLALAHYKQGQFSHATGLFRLGTILRPEPFASYDPEVLGLFDQAVNLDDDAGVRTLEQFIAAKQAVVRQPGADAHVRESLADALYVFGRPDEAIEQYRILLETGPGNVTTLVKLGAAYLANDQPFLAYACFNQAIERDSGCAPAHIGAGMVMLERGAVDTAILQFKLATVADTSNAQAFNLLGNAYQTKGMLDQAIEEYRRAITVRPEYAQAYDNLGAALMAQEDGRLEEAVQAFEKAVELRPDYAKAWRHLGTARQKAGNAAGAVAAWRNAAQYNPYDVEVAELLKTAGQSGQDRRSEPR